MREPTIGYLLWRVTTRFRAAVDRAVAPVGLTHAQYSLMASLYALSRTGARPSQRELADFSGLEPIYVSKLVRALAEAGLLTRTEHPADPRAVQLRLTRRGTDVVQRAIPIVRDLQEELTAPIGGTRGRRGRELARILNVLLDKAPETRSDTMSQTPTLTGQDIAEAQGAVRGLLDRVLAGSGRSSNEYVVMRVLTARGPSDPAALHEFLAGQRQLALDRAGVAELLGGLEVAGLVSGSAVDGSGPVRLTEAGAALYAALSAKVGQVTTRLYADLDADDLATAHRVLGQVAERARDLP